MYISKCICYVSQVHFLSNDSLFIMGRRQEFSFFSKLTFYSSITLTNRISLHCCISINGVGLYLYVQHEFNFLKIPVIKFESCGIIFCLVNTIVEVLKIVSYFIKK